MIMMMTFHCKNNASNLFYMHGRWKTSVSNNLYACPNHEENMCNKFIIWKKT